MKNILLIIAVSLIAYSCDCEREEVSRDLLKPENKEYLKTNSRTVEYSNQDNEIIEVTFDGAKSIISEERVGPESCSYSSNEQGEENFSFGSTTGKILYRNIGLFVTININDSYNSLYVQDFISEINNNKLETIQINGFTFENVLVLEKNTHETPDGLVNKIVYSKTHGIEFILFEDGTWYKRVE